MEQTQQRIARINEQTPQTEPQLTYYQDGGSVDYLLMWPEPTDSELESGEWDERILAVDEFNNNEIDSFLSGAEHMIYILTWKSPCN